MRRVVWRFGLAALLAAGAGMAAAGLVEGCTAPLGDCSKYAHAGCPGYGGSATGTGGGTTDGGGTGGGDGDSDAPCPSCP
jgi:hypothetical protein